MAVTAQTKKQIRDEIILRLTMGKPSGDFEISNSQIDRVIDISRDKFVADLLFKTGQYDGSFRDATYIKSESDLALSAVTNSDELKATVVQPILSTPLNDYGLVRVRVHAKTGDAYTRAKKVDTLTLDDINTMEFTAPSITNPVVYRKGQVLYFSGLISGYTGTHDIYVDYVEAMTGSDTDYSISEAHVSDITNMAEEVLRRELGMLIIDEINDGSQVSQAKQG